MYGTLSLIIKFKFIIAFLPIFHGCIDFDDFVVIDVVDRFSDAYTHM